MDNGFKIPVLFLIFNRPDTTKKVFDEIRKIKPRYLYIAADGPQSGKKENLNKSQETRKITENIDWRCKVKRLYRDKNLGCGKAVSSAINWFFENVESGIILEDDCLPDRSFFSFSEAMLKKYKKDSKIMHISGDNFLNYKDQDRNSYMLSSYPHIWGWATWRRAWEKYDFDMKDWRQRNLVQKLKFAKGSLWNKIYWIAMFDGIVNGGINTWDFQWVNALMKNNGLSIVPGVNLVSNIGFGKDSSHTKSANYTLSNVRTVSINKNFKLNNNMNIKNMDKIEEDEIFKVSSAKTLVSFAYFSIIRTIFHI